MRRGIALACLALVAAATGCGDSGGGKPLPKVSVALDFTPNAVHAPIYAAIRDGLDRRAGVRVHIPTPGASPGSLKNVLARSAAGGGLDNHYPRLAREKGRGGVPV